MSNKVTIRSIEKKSLNNNKSFSNEEASTKYDYNSNDDDEILPAFKCFKSWNI